MALRVLFRVDAAREIGSGHVMRCLCLAEALRSAGHVCQFLCRRREGDMIEAIEARGFDCTVLPAPVPVPSGAGWLGSALADEIQQASAVVAAEAPDWLVVDHYAIDATWEQAVAPAATKVMVIDDLADRPHICDLLLDQQLYSQPGDYAVLIPNRARMLLGPAYALLRPEFAELRAAAEARVRNSPPARILVNMGGVDPENATKAVLDTLDCSDLPDGCVIDVVMGRDAPHVETVRGCAATSRLDVRVTVDVTDMGARMLAADLAIGAAGTTSWERACLGLPSLMLSIAENQLHVADALDQAGAAVNIGPISEQGWQDRLLAGLAALSAPGQIAEMSATGRALVDGKGTARVVQALITPSLVLRPCRMEDTEPVWRWREAEGAWQFYRSGVPTPWEEHKRWFAAALDDVRRKLYIVEENGCPVAHLRFDFPNTGLPEVGLAVDPEKKGASLGSCIVAMAICHAREMGWPGLSAEVHEENVTSGLVFQRNGFRRVGRNGTFIRYQIEINKGAAT